MSQLSSSAQTISRLGITGIGTDNIGVKLYLFQQFNAKIIGYESRYGSYGGVYYVEGNIGSFIDTFDYFWVNSRKSQDSNIFIIDSYEYLSDKFCTKVFVNLYDVDGGDYSSSEGDVGANICGRFDATDYLADIGNVSQSLIEDNSIGGSVISKFNFCLDNEDKTFYDKVNKTGYFYKKDIQTEIFSVASQSEYSFNTDLFVTYVKVRDLQSYSGSSFVNGRMEFLSGDYIGDRALIVGSNGYNLQVLGHYSSDYKNVNKYNAKVNKGDKVHIYTDDVYWVRLDVWHRDYKSETVNLFTGKIDLDSVKTNDKNRTIEVECCDILKDYMDSNIAKLNFDMGLNLPRMKEVKGIYLDKCYSNRLKNIIRGEVDPNPLASLNVLQVGFDVEEGWHIVDFCPNGNLFRFDLGRWCQAVDEGSLEVSTQSIFLPGNPFSTKYDYTAVLPDHTLYSNTDEENVKIERKWHGRWCSISLELKEDFYTGSLSNQKLKSGTKNWKKFSGLPTEPCKLLFYVDSERNVIIQKVFSYNYDNGYSIIPNLFFDYIEECYYQSEAVISSDNWTYDAGFGSLKDRKTAAGYVFDDSGKGLRAYCFKKFNGILVSFHNVDSSYDSYIARMLQNLEIKYTIGNSGYGPKFNSNINTKYLGGYAISGTGADTLVLEFFNEIKSSENPNSYDSNYTDIANMWLLCVSGSNAFQSRKINTVTQVVGDLSRVTLTLKTSFSNNISANDKFVVINKDEDIRFIGIGDSFKDGENPDVLAKESNDLTTGTFYDITNEQKSNAMFSDLYFKPGDIIHIGHRQKFNAFSIGVDINTTSAVDDYADLVWYLRRDFLTVEYYNGNEWKKATNVVIIPTSVKGLSDVSSVVDDDDIIKYKVAFDAYDWNCGSYDSSAYGTGGSPSDIDEDNIYMIRVKVSVNLPFYLKYVSLGFTKDFNLAIVWNDIKYWHKNNVSIYGSKYIADTMTYDNLYLNMFGIELKTYSGAYSYIHQMRPIEKLVGSNGDIFYSVIDINNIEEKFNTDIIVPNSKLINKFTTIPTNINYLYFINKIIDDGGNKYNKAIRRCNDDMNVLSDNIVNLIGTRYDGVYPFAVGFDGAFVTEDLEEYEELVQNVYDDLNESNIQGVHFCIIRDNGYYRLYVVNLTSIRMYYTTDFRATGWQAWTDGGDIISNLGDYKIIGLDVVKNKEDNTYAFYITARDTVASDRYKLYVYTGTDPDDIDMSAMSEIIDLADNNVGSVSVLHIKGLCSDTSDCRRIAWVTVYDAKSITDDLPTDASEIRFYQNIDYPISSHWSHDDGYGNDYSVIDDAKDPAFVVGNYAVNDGNVDDNFINMFFTILFTRSNKLYKSFANYQSESLDGDSWSSGIQVGEDNNFINGFSVIKDGIEYYYLNDSSRSAFTLIPSSLDAHILYGKEVGTGAQDLKIRVVNLELNQWSTGYLRDVVPELNDYDWFMTHTASLRMKKSSGTNKYLYVGFRNKFNKLDAIQYPDLDLSIKLKVEYWNGIEWDSIDEIYQLKDRITDSEICPHYGFYFIEPIDWRFGDLEDIVTDFVNSNKRMQSLYWLRFSVPSDYDDNTTIAIKGFRNCYTALFLTSGRNLYLLDNWSYVKHIYTFANETDKKIKIDSISYDKEDKNVIVNVVNDGNYGYELVDSYIFDVFGKFMKMVPVWDTGDQHITLKDRPKSIFRAGAEQEVDTSIDSAATTFKVALIGGWLDTYIEELYNSGTFTGDAFVGYNVPIPKPQMVRKFSLRNTNWELSTDNWDVDFLNNILIARTLSEKSIAGASNADYLLYSLTNNGLLNEELVNGPVIKLLPGYYSAIEKSFLTLAVKYDILIDSEITSLPGAPSDDDNYLVADNSDPILITKINNIATYVDATYGWSYQTPVVGTIIYIDSTNTYKWWNGTEWLEYSTSVIWPGRINTMDIEGIGLEFTVGQEGVKVPYFRSFNNKPNRFLNNNVNGSFDDKVVKVFRNVPCGIENSTIFGHNADSVSVFPFNLRPTCAVEMPDLSALKDEDYSASVRVLENASPAMAFGSYMFKDVSLDMSDNRENGDDSVNPLGISAINIFKMQGKVQNWKKAYYYDSSTYTDITSEMNYKTGTGRDISGGGKYIYLCSSTRFFSFLVNAYNDLRVEYYASDGSWKTITPTIDRFNVNNYIVYSNNDEWSNKTIGMLYTYNPFVNDWVSKVFQFLNGYWIRLSPFGIYTESVQWANLSGVCVWDSMRWWDDYNIISSKDPSDYTQGYDYLSEDDKRYYDTFIPISIEYDVVRKRLIGCFWNFITGENKYYPFAIQFDHSYFDDPDNSPTPYWSYNPEYMDIVDMNGYNYSLKVQSIKNISPIDNKVLLVDEANPNGIVYMGTIKNYESGQHLFPFNLG